MNGNVTSLHAMLPVTIMLANHREIEIDFVIDTGYTRFLTLPITIVETLELPFEYDLPANLADDSEVLVPVYTAAIRWDAEVVKTRVLALGKRPLLGTAMLDQYELLCRFKEGGKVIIEKLT